MKLPSALVSVLSDLQVTADVGDDLAPSQVLLSRFDLADYLLGCVADSFHGGVPDPVRLDETLIHCGPITGVHLRVKNSPGSSHIISLITLLCALVICQLNAVISIIA